MGEFGSTLARYISVSKAAVQAMTPLRCGPCEALTGAGKLMTEHGSADWVKQIPLTSFNL